MTQLPAQPQSPRARAIRDGIDWLRRHQDEDGRMRCAEFLRHDREGKPCDGAGQAAHDVGVTALALLALVEAPAEVGPLLGCEAQATNAVRWLVSQQRDDGQLGSPETSQHVVQHALALLALARAQELLVEPVLRESLQRAADCSERMRNPYKVWRYQPRDGDNDSFVTGWMVLGLAAAEAVGAKAGAEWSKFATMWWDEITGDGVAGYDRRGRSAAGSYANRVSGPAEPTFGLTGLAVLSRYALGQDEKSHRNLERSVVTLKGAPARIERTGDADLCAAAFVAKALRRGDRNSWATWCKMIEPQLLAAQRHDGNSKGSWDPIDRWSDAGGRVYSTALALQVLAATSPLPKDGAGPSPSQRAWWRLVGRGMTPPPTAAAPPESERIRGWQADLAGDDIERARAAALALQPHVPAAAASAPTLALCEGLGLMLAPHVSSRVRGAQQLAGLGPTAAPAVPDLVPLLEGADLELRLAVLTALGKIGPAARAAIPQLAQLLGSSHAGTRNVAWTALRRICAF